MVAQFQHANVQSGIGFGQAGIGHVLEAATHRKMVGNVPSQTDMAGKLKAPAEIRASKTIAADDCRTGPALQRQGNMPLPQLQQRAGGPDNECGESERASTVVA